MLLKNKKIYIGLLLAVLILPFVPFSSLLAENDMAFVNYAQCDVYNVNCVVAKPTNTSEGDIMIALATTYYASSFTATPENWNLIDSYVDNTDRYYLYYKIAGASEPASYTWTVGASIKVTVTIGTYRGGFDSSDPIDAYSDTPYRTSDNILRAASINVTNTNSNILYVGGVNTGYQTRSILPPTSPATFTENVDVWGSYADYLTTFAILKWSGSGSTGDVDGTISNTHITKHAFLIAFNPEGGEPPTPEDTCAYSGAGDWNVLESDNCYINSSIYVAGALNIIGGPTGSFGCNASISYNNRNMGGAVTINRGTNCQMNNR